MTSPSHPSDVRTARHAPTPWVFSPWHIEEGAPAVRQGTINGYIIATTDTDDNAAFIVRAVNSHDELVEALETAVLVLSALSPEDESLYGPRALTLARAALAKVKP